MTEIEREILDTLARLETKWDAYEKHLNDLEERMRSLEKKWLTTMGAFVISIVAYLQALFTR